MASIFGSSYDPSIDGGNAAPAGGGSPASSALQPAVPAQAPANVTSFVDAYLPVAQRVSEKTGVAPEVLLGQWGLETGWGKSVIPGTNNLGNIKDFSRRADSVYAVDNQTKTNDAYRRYASADDFGDEYAGLIARRYASAVNSGDDSQKFFSDLKRLGYAEDKDYVTKGVQATNLVAAALGRPQRQVTSIRGSRPTGGDFVTPTGRDYVMAAKPRESATMGDYLKELAASGVESFGSIAQFAGEGAAAIANKVTGTSDYESFNPLKPASEAIRNTMTEGGKQARAGANVEGSVVDLLSGEAELPSSVDSWGMMLANGFGSLASTIVPIAGPAARVASLTKAARAAEAAGDAAKASELFASAQAAARTSRAIGVGTGGAMTGGAAADDVRQSAAAAVAKMGHEDLMAQVPAYAEAFATTGDEQAARQAVVNSAAQYAALGAAAFGAAGGYLNARVLEDFVAKKGMAKVLGDSFASRTGRATVGGGVGTLAEGGQETGEKVGQNVGENIGLGRAAGDNVLRNTAGDFLGGVLVGGPVGAVGGFTSSPSVPPELKPVSDKAAEPNSPLSKAALAGNASALSAPTQPGIDPAQSGQPPADPRGPAADDLVQRVRNLEEGMRNEGWLDNLRADGLDSRDVMLDMALARNTNAPRRAREEALERIESSVYFANRDAPPAAPMDSIQNYPEFDNTPAEPAAPREVPPLDAVAGALRDPNLRGKISDTDRQQLLYLYNLANNSQGQQTVRVNAAQQALEIVGRYQAPTGTPSGQAAPTLERAASTAAGSAAPDAQQNVGESPKELDFLTTAPTPKQPRGPLGGDTETPAFLRKRLAVVKQLVDNGFETVVRDDGGFFLTNARTGQKFKLDGPADAQLARKTIKDRVDALANTAAASPKNDLLEPTEAQIAAGNYKKSDVIDLNGMKIKIENPQGSTRRGTSPDGKAWETKMAHHYGEFQGTVGADGDKLDVFVGPRPDSDKVFVVDQVNKDGSFDEHKVMMGFTSEGDARQGYLANYEKGWTGLGGITEMTVEQFRGWAKSRAAKKPAASMAAAPAPAAETPLADVDAAVTSAEEKPAATSSSFFYVNDGGKQRKLKLLRSDELPKAISAQRKGAPRPLSQDEAALIQAIAGILKKQAVFYEAQDGRLSDGFVFPSRPDTIFVATETTINPLAVFGHEFFHTLRETNPKAWDAIAAVVRSRVIDAKGFRKDRYGKKTAEQRGDAALSEEAGGELEELVSDLGGNLLKDSTFWAEVFNKIQEEHGPEGKGIIAQVAAALRDLIARVINAVQQPGYRADSFVKDLDQVRGAFRDAMADYLKGANITQRAMAAETLKTEQKIKKSEDRVKRAHTQLKKNGPNDWSATTDLRDEGIPVLLQTRTSGGALITSATEFVDGRETTKNITGTPKMKVDQMSIGTHHKRVVQRFREMAKIAGIRKSEDRPDDKPEGLTVTGYHFSQQPRATLSTGFYGTGLKGSARDEILSFPDGRIRKRLSFYYDKGTGVRPESGVGGIAHKATLTNIYDADKDPLNLKGGNARVFESKVLDAGYSGYLTRLEGTQPGQVILLGDQTITPEILGPRSRIDGSETGVEPAPAPPAPPIKKGLMSRELNELNVDAIPGATLRAGTLTVPADSVDQANAELERIGSSVRFSPDRETDIERARREYAEVEAKYKGTDQWLKAPNGADTNLSERQWVQVRTPSFKGWFGDWEAFAGQTGGVWNDDKGEVSKVVDSNGEPLVVYHGSTQGGFTTFDEPGGTKRGDLGIFTTDDEGMAASYVRRNRPRRIELPSDPTNRTELEELGYSIDEYDGGFEVTSPDGYFQGRYDTVDEAVADTIANFEMPDRAGEQPGVYALFVNIRRPEESHFDGANWDGERYGQYEVRDADGGQIFADDGRTYLSEDEARDLAAQNEGAEVQRADSHYETTDSVVRAARRSNADGAIIRQVTDDGGGPGYDGEPADLFVALKPNQLKSADFNGGVFSLSEDDIRKSADRVTDTPEFKRWFGDSRAVVAVNAKTGQPVVSSREPKKLVPQVMYHTTRNDFTEFEIGRITANSGTFGSWDTSRAAVFVTPDLEASQAYGTQGGEFEPGANVMPLYIKAENPLDLTGGLSEEAEQKLLDAGMFRGIVNRLGSWSMFDDEDGRYVVDMIKKAGYDSVIFNDENPDTGDSFEAWALFDPKQIKSVIGNNGAFDPTNPDIRKTTDRAGDASLHNLVAERGERAVASRVVLSDAERKAIEKSVADTGLDASEIESTVRDAKAAHPTSNGWAQLVFLGAKLETDSSGKQTVEYSYQNVPYSFNVGADGRSLEKGSKEYDNAVRRVAGGMVADVRAVYERAKKGDKAASNIIAQAAWYKAMRERLRREFGGLGDLYADLLGATSPNTPVRGNWDNAIDSLRRALRGDYDEMMPKWLAWAENVNAIEERFRDFFGAMRERGLSKKAIKELGEYKWLAERAKEAREFPEDLLPTKESGKNYGFNGQNVVRAMIDLWRVVKNADPDIGRGGTAPKALNFSGNLIGFRARATIDVWAARNLQRNAGKPRIPSMAETGVSGAMLTSGETTLQFGFGQDVFTQAADWIRADVEMSESEVLSKLNDDDLQALVWFVEKEIWTRNNWTSAAGEGGSFEFEADLAGVQDQARVRELRRIADSSISATAAQKEVAQARIYEIADEIEPYLEAAQAMSVVVKATAAVRKAKKSNTGTAASERAITKAQAKLDDAKSKLAAALEPLPKSRRTSGQVSARISDLRKQAERLAKTFDRPLPEQLRKGRESALRELTRMSRTLDRFILGLSVQTSTEIQGESGVPTDAKQAQVAGEIHKAAYAGDDGRSLMAAKVYSTEGRYGTPERSFDGEFVARDGYNPRPLAAKVFEVAQRERQDSAFVARVLRPDEAVDLLRHRPGVEIYFRDSADAEKVEQMMRRVARTAVPRGQPEGDSRGDRYFRIAGYTVVVDGRRTPQALSGAMPRAVGMRIMYLPEFNARYGDTSWNGLTDQQIVDKMKAATADLDRLVRRVESKLPDASFAGTFYYEVDARFNNEYKGAIDAYSDRNDAGAAQEPAGRVWAGRSVREAVAAATGRDGAEPAEQGAEASGGQPAAGGAKPEVRQSSDRAPEAARPQPQERDEVASAEARGRKVTYDVEVGDTGDTAKLTVDAGEALDDYDRRIATINNLLGCLRK